MSTRDKVAENRVRRALARRGLTLHKSARRDPGSMTYGLYRVLKGSSVIQEWTLLETIEALISIEREIAMGGTK